MVPITYFSDVLCVWAYIAQRRIDEAKSQFGDAVAFDLRFCSVFGDTPRKIAAQWGPRGGYIGFADHLSEAAAAFPDAPIDPRVWRDVRPASSTGAHLFLKAVQLAESDGHCEPGTAEKALCAMRQAFFRDGRDIARRQVQEDVGRAVGAAPALVTAFIDDGTAFAALSADYQDAAAAGIAGSPSFVLNDGRQKLYGNVGYRIIEANILELMREPRRDQASWC